MFDANAITIAGIFLASILGVAMFVEPVVASKNQDDKGKRSLENGEKRKSLNFDESTDEFHRGRSHIVTARRSNRVFVPSGVFIMGPSRTDSQLLKRVCHKELSLARPFCEQSIVSGNFLAPLVGTYGIGARRVYVSSFYIGRYEVRVGDYRRCVRANGCFAKPLIIGKGRHVKKDSWPMVNVTWDEAEDYCRFVGGRLPSEAEWEKAARGNDQRRWPWGNVNRIDGANHGKSESPAVMASQQSSRRRQPLLPRYAPDDSDGMTFSAPVGVMKWSRGPYGTYDQAGNVSEWVSDYFSVRGYQDLSRVDPHRSVPPAEHRHFRGVRGGSWMMPKLYGFTFMRWASPQNNRSETRGFRCAWPASSP